MLGAGGPEDGVEPREVRTLRVAFDHRGLDGYQAGRMAKRLREALEDPDRWLGDVAESALPY